MIAYLARDSHLKKPTAIGNCASHEHLEMAVAKKCCKERASR